MQEQLLERIAIALENLKQKPSLTLGLGAPPSPQYIFVGNEPEQELWYFLGENSQKNYIQQKALTGTIKSLEIVHREYKGQEHLKLDVTMECDRTYVIRSGFGTVFSKGLLLALNTLHRSEIALPLTIAVAPGDENVVFHEPSISAYLQGYMTLVVKSYYHPCGMGTLILSVSSHLFKTIWRLWLRRDRVSG